MWTGLSFGVRRAVLNRENFGAKALGLVWSLPFDWL